VTFTPVLQHDALQVVNKVRGKLTKLERKTLSALIVIDVHARDVVVDLADKKVASETDFEWMSQLRLGLTSCMHAFVAGAHT
jgi:dynein heavy chain, axonemal